MKKVVVFVTAAVILLVALWLLRLWWPQHQWLGPWVSVGGISLFMVLGALFDRPHTGGRKDVAFQKSNMKKLVLAVIAGVVFILSWAATIVSFENGAHPGGTGFFALTLTSWLVFMATIMRAKKQAAEAAERDFAAEKDAADAAQRQREAPYIQRLLVLNDRLWRLGLPGIQFSLPKNNGCSPSDTSFLWLGGVADTCYYVTDEAALARAEATVKRLEDALALAGERQGPLIQELQGISDSLTPDSANPTPA